jgi:ElaB/YqjD/DUF883 family membrane-anchored ribosome-binding protein
MNQTTKDVKAELEKSIAHLRTLRDEVKVQLHLGGLDAKEEWRRLEPRLESALERAGKEVSAASKTLVEDVTEAVRTFRKSLR